VKVAPRLTGDPTPFFVSVADKGLGAGVSGLESTVAGISVSIDSKGDGFLGGWCGRSPTRGCLGLGQWTGVAGCLAEALAQ
jgi:hypothetical protein